MSNKAAVTVAGLGPAGADLITAGTRAAMYAAEIVRLRTTRHPAAEGLGYPSYDEMYEKLETFDAVYAAIIEDLVALASSHREVLYLVPGSPVVAETTVSLLMQDTRIVCEVLPAMSFLDLAWARLGVDPVECEVHVRDGHLFGSGQVQLFGPTLIAQCSSRAVLSDIKLDVDPAPLVATLLHHLGLDDERIETIEWSEIDRTIEADHLTSLFIPDS